MKHLAFACWEDWQSYVDTNRVPDWDKIGKDNNIDPATAQTLAVQWEDMLFEQEMVNDYDE